MKYFSNFSKIFLTGMLVLLLAFGLALAGCDTDGNSGSAPPVGRYTSAENFSDSINFSGSAWQMVQSSRTYTGTFTVSGNRLTLNHQTPHVYQEVWTIVNSTTIRDNYGYNWNK